MNLITIQKLEDGTYARSLLAYPTDGEAMAALYSTMGSAVASSTVASCSCVLMNDQGEISKVESYAGAEE